MKPAPIKPTTAGKSVFLYSTLDTFDMARGPVRMALDYCAATGASLAGMILNLETSQEPGFTARNLEELRTDHTAREALNASHAAALEQEATKLGIDAHIITSLNHSHGLPANVADRARLHDLCFIGTDARGMMGETVIAEHLLFAGGRPVMVVPSQQVAPCPPRKIAVAWDNSRQSARALGDAMPFLAAAEEAFLLTISEEKKITSSIPMDEIIAILARKGVQIRHENRPLNDKPIGRALQDGARSLGADMLVMGGFASSRMRQFLLGGATRDVLQNADMPILIAH